MCYLFMELLKRRLNDLGFHPTEFCYLFLSAFFLEKINTNRVLPNEFLLVLTKIYIINLLYGILHFSFSVKIIHHTFSSNNFCFSVCERVFPVLITSCGLFQKQLAVGIRHFSSFFITKCNPSNILLRNHDKFHPLLIIYLE